MKVIAIIEDPDGLRNILQHLVKIGRSHLGSTSIASTETFLRCAFRARCVCFLAQTVRKPLVFLLQTLRLSPAPSYREAKSLPNVIVAVFREISPLIARFAVALRDRFSYHPAIGL